MIWSNVWFPLQSTFSKYQAYCDFLNEVLFENANTFYPEGYKLQEDNLSIQAKFFTGIRTTECRQTA